MNSKSKLVLLKKSLKNLSLIKCRRQKKKIKSRAKSNLVHDNYFTFYKYQNTNEFTKRPSALKLKELNEFKEKFIIILLVY